ncbi:MAG TPA: tRNA-dihydrouridine synthase [Candidatus Krumholzibacteria bacterium]|nr:tRNA-dihydrouridine synthase [Candidatus Krumholzibacteria bacterium]HPD70965.1 tRNA-dihydrouridine synthase [Candidatus Krumholzibacteria bacterium]HRY39335.1 tRNA-dihydrouridine synthase [Candidatus Krumholzibacteria bacterium]
MNRPGWWRLDPCAPFALGPRTLPGRIWTASGCFGYGLHGHDIAAPDLATPYEGIGAVVTKTVTPQPRPGNPMPRLVELPFGAINSIGLENVGFAAFLRDVLPELEARGVPNVVSLAATRPAEFGTMAARLYEVGRGLRHWHGVELNLSCPNVAEGGHDFGSDPATVAACVAAARPHLPDRILVAKLTPNVAQIAPLAAAAAQAGCDAVAAINTVVGLDVDTASGRPVLPRRFGGYSGLAIQPIALAKVDEIVREVGVPVVGVGGIVDARDALKFFALGCVAVQVGTAQMRDPFAAARLAAELRR